MYPGELFAGLLDPLAELQHVVAEVLEQHTGGSKEGGQTLHVGQPQKGAHEAKAVETAEGALNLVLMPRYKGLHGVVSSGWESCRTLCNLSGATPTFIPLWLRPSGRAVVFRLDPSRSHEVPEGHFAGAVGVVLMVDRYSAYKAMVQVKLGNVVLVFCWSHVRRDFVKVGKAFPEHKEWALAWLRRIRDLYRFQRQRLTAPAGSAEFVAADTGVRQTVAAMKAQAELELADPKLATACRKALESLLEHWAGLTRFVGDLRIPMDNNSSERQNRGPALGRKNYYGSGALWSGRLAAMLFSLFATLRLSNINVRKWLTWFLQSCAQNGGQVPADINSFLPWNMSQERRRELALDPDDSS